MSKWYSIKCSDCGKAIAFSSAPIVAAQAYCYQCAHSHAEVAGYMMPIANGYSVNGLHEVDNFGKTEQNQQKFNQNWRPICKQIQHYKVAKKKNT